MSACLIISSIDRWRENLAVDSRIQRRAIATHVQLFYNNNNLFVNLQTRVEINSIEMRNNTDDNTSNILKQARTKRLPHEEDCQDKACSDAKKDFNFWLRNKQQKANTECPLDRESLGRNTWSLLHTMATKYPLAPSKEDKTNMGEFIRLFSLLYPCSYCAKEFRDDIKELPPKLDSRHTLALWFCQVHNKVNKKLNKPQFDCSKVDERWRTGPKDGSCL